MNKHIKLLSAILAGQILLAAGGILFRDRVGSFEATRPLVGIGSDAYDGVTVADFGRPPVAFAKRDGVWTLSDRWGFPVSPEKWAQTLEKIQTIKRSWPVGSTASARKRFKVTDQAYEKRVAFLQGGKEKAALFIGAAPEYRKAYVRPSDSDDVFSVELAVHEFAADPSEWENKSVLHIAKDSLARVEVGAVHLVKKDAGFQLEDLKENEEMIGVEVEALIRQVTTINYQEVMGKDVLPQQGLSSPILTIGFDSSAGSRTTYTLAKPAKGDGVFLKSSSGPFVFRIASSTLDSIRSAVRSKLVKRK